VFKCFVSKNEFPTLTKEKSLEPQASADVYDVVHSTVSRLR